MHFLKQYNDSVWGSQDILLTWNLAQPFIISIVYFLPGT